MSLWAWDLLKRNSGCQRAQRSRETDLPMGSFGTLKMPLGRHLFMHTPQPLLAPSPALTHLLRVCRVAGMVCDPVVHRPEAGRVGVADPCDLDWRGPPGHGTQAVVGGVAWVRERGCRMMPGL